ncbi:uncharacterized protein LOC128549191 [Mercenaria mercenaria]|uniref:uncharacterized protein LOC128549191 n=1 Tax=Mercenaria mercenaria TaxID=6596 RepID=UPI00234FB0DD|nr:uncharacterized protein LOC128549191 [Mercenaria mercenaria]
MVLETVICDLVLGNISGVLDKPDDKWVGRDARKVEATDTDVAAVVTRAQAEKEKKPMKPLKVPVIKEDEITVELLKKAQSEDKSLNRLWRYAEEKKIKATKGGNKYRYEISKDVLYRIFESVKGDKKVETKQIVVPKIYQKRVMSLAHESIVGGHLSVRKTIDIIQSSFHWPGISSDVTRFCRSCDICQKTVPKSKVQKVPLGEMPIIDAPFQRVAVDLIGPISPVSEKGNILTVVDYATRYPEAVALPRIVTENVAEALLDIFSRVGFPSEILSDRGSQFTSQLMEEVCRLVSLKQLFTTPYNPKCNGLCERMNGILKSMLKKMCEERPKDWDRYISAVLFAYGEVPQGSTGFSPFELLYGRTVRGPMQALKELWTESEVPETRNTYEYVLDLQNRLEETCRIARESLSNAQVEYKHHYDKKARARSLEQGDKVLVLLPTSHNKLMLQRKGPFEVAEVVNKFYYKVKIGDRVGVYHINLLKKYEEREDKVCASVAVIEAEIESETGVVDDESLLNLVNTSGTETYRDVCVNELLSREQKAEVYALLEEFKDIFTDVPGTTDLEQHKIDLTDETPIRVKQYTIPYAKRKDVENEIKNMLEAGVIEPANSDYNSPVVLVKKKDNTNRFCIDFRRINSFTRFDTEPMGNVEDIMAKLREDNYFTKIDLTKGYWQIPIEEKSRHLTAFSTPEGSYQFRKMPFGMVNSGATFNRTMRKLLAGIKDADNYVDDVLGHTITWERHVMMLRNVFTRIREARLTVKPSKCMIGFGSISFTGHVVGDGTMQMEDDKLDKIRSAERPETKKQLRSFLGLAGYYRKFIGSFAAPLTDLMKKGQPNKIVWRPDHETAFRTLKQLLTRAPILRLPDFSKPFVLQCDASDTGVGAALPQRFDDGLFPIAYASKKLLKRGKNYSVIERECLAMVFGIKKFHKYLYGQQFELQTDHAPLTYIQKCKVESGRIMRWALFLQNYKFRIEAVKGTDNVCADYLSRLYT